MRPEAHLPEVPLHKKCEALIIYQASHDSDDYLLCAAKI